MYPLAGWSPTSQVNIFGEAVTKNEDGSITVDMAKADAEWNKLDTMARAEFTNMIFEPILRNATTMRLALEAIIAKKGRSGTGPEMAAIAESALAECGLSK